MLFGQIIPWDKDFGQLDYEFRRTIAGDKSVIDFNHNLQHSGNAYSGHAAMSFDGLIRPVSMDGDGSLPRYAQIEAGCNLSSSKGAQPPVSSGSEDYYSLNINLDYLNPLSNPTSKARSDINDRHSGDVGHDIDMVARGDNTDIDHMVLGIAGTGKDDSMDYYDDY